MELKNFGKIGDTTINQSDRQGSKIVLWGAQIEMHFDADTLTEQYMEVEGHLIQIQVFPPAFREAEKKVSRLVDQKNYSEAEKLIESLPLQWQNHPDFVRLSGFLAIEKEEEDLKRFEDPIT